MSVAPVQSRHCPYHHICPRTARKGTESYVLWDHQILWVLYLVLSYLQPILPYYLAPSLLGKLLERKTGLLEVQNGQWMLRWEGAFRGREGGGVLCLGWDEVEWRDNMPEEGQAEGGEKEESLFLSAPFKLSLRHKT